MDVLSVNSERKLANLASTIGRNPMSWDGWNVLFISLHGLSGDVRQDCLIWTKSIAGSYLGEIEGRIYFCHDHGIHIICKDARPQILEQAGAQLCDMIFDESGVYASYFLYALETDGFEYAAAVLEAFGNVLSLPESRFGAAQMAGNLPDIDIETCSAAQLKRNPDGHVPKVLLIEDDAVTRWMVRHALKDECDFATANCANKAFSMYASYEPDIVFLDINLPDASGYAVLEWIMKNDPGAYVVMFSSNDNLDNITLAIEEGASGFIAKPFLKKNLLHYVRHGLVIS